MKLYTQLSTTGSYKPIEYYSCNYLLDVQSDLLINFSHPELLTVCDHCQSLLSYHDNSVLLERPTDHGSQYSDFCVRCLYKLLNSKPVPQGRYFVRTANIFSIRTANWRVADQILLLKAIQTYGFGNWATISVWMQSHGSFINKKRSEEHFYRYLWDKKRPLFDEEIHFIQSCLESNREESIREKKLKLQNQNRSLIWSVQRKQFLVQYNWQAQSIVADIEFTSNDSPDEIKMKEAMLIKYNEKLKERMIKKKFAIEQDLLPHIEGNPVKLEDTQNKPSPNVKSQKSTTEIKPSFMSIIFENEILGDSIKSIDNFIDSSKRYFIDDEEMKETKKLARYYIISSTLLHTLKTETDGKKKYKERKDLMQKVSEKILKKVYK